MRYFALIAVTALGAVGCGQSNDAPKSTPEMEAQQKQAEKEVHDAESRMQTKQKRSVMSPEQQVQEAESRLPKQPRK